MLYIGENNDTKANKNVANPYLKLFDDNARRATFQIKAGNGIAVASDANGNITITNSSPDVNHNTDERVRQVPKTDNINRPLMMINGNTSTGEQINTSMFSTGIYANASTKMITANGFIKAGSSDNYVLLGGGGHKVVSDFATSSHTHSYLPLAGGTMAGTALISWPSSGNWENSNSGVTFPVTRGGLQWSGQSDWIKLFSQETSSDNLNLVLQFGDDNSNGLSIRNASGTQTAFISATGYITAVQFNGPLNGNASSATKLTSSAGSTSLPIYFSDGKPVACTASSIFSNLSNSGNNLSITVAGQNRTLTVGYATSSGYANGIAKKDILDSQEKIDNFITSNRFQYASFNGSNNLGFVGNDGMILSMPWGSSVDFGAQMAFDDATSGTVKVRGKDHSWGSWYTLLHSGNYNNYAPTKTGTGASGTWDISISGNAATATSAGSTKNLIGYSQINYKADLDVFVASNTIKHAMYQNAKDVTEDTRLGIPLGDGMVMSWGWPGNTNYAWQIAIEDSGQTNHMAIRNKSNNAWGAWKIFLTSANYNSYSPTLTGGGASGTWNINISGNADTLDGNHASAFAAASHTHSYLPLSGAFITGTNIADMKVNIRNYFRGKPAGTNCYVGSPNINNFQNDSAGCSSSSICGITALNPAYDNYNHGHFLVSHCGDNRIGMIGLGYLNWYGPNWFAYTSDIPTRVSQLTNDSGFITSNHTHAWGNLICGSNGGDTYTYRALKAYGCSSTAYINFGYAPSTNNAGEIGFVYSGSGSGSNYMTLGFYGQTNRFNIYANNTISYVGNITASNFYSSSDIRLKNNINNISKSIRSFNWKESGQKSYGLIAQEIENEYPELVSSNDNGYKSINYTSALCMLVAKLENGLDKLKEKVKQLENKLSKYENTL